MIWRIGQLAGLLALAVGLAVGSSGGAERTRTMNVRVRVDGVRARLDRVVPGLMRRFHVPGVAIAILDARGPSTLLSYGYADLSTGTRVQDDTVFEAASLGKPLFCYAVLHHAGMHAFDPDRPIANYLGSEAILDPASAAITGRQLFSHSSGLAAVGPEHHLQMVWRPGTAWHYSGAGYLIVQRAVERLWHEPLQRLVAETVTEPLGMVHTSYLPPHDAGATVATGYDRQGHQLPVATWASASAASSLHTSATDYGRFVSAMLAGIDSGDARTREMIRPQIAVDRKLALFWGTGWAVAKPHGDNVFLHWGSNPGFKSLALGSVSRNLGMVVLTNGDNGLEVATALVPIVFGRHFAFLKFRMLHPND